MRLKTVFVVLNRRNISKTKKSPKVFCHSNPNNMTVECQTKCLRLPYLKQISHQLLLELTRNFYMGLSHLIHIDQEVLNLFYTKAILVLRTKCAADAADIYLNNRFKIFKTGNKRAHLYWYKSILSFLNCMNQPLPITV